MFQIRWNNVPAYGECLSHTQATARKTLKQSTLARLRTDV